MSGVLSHDIGDPLWFVTEFDSFRMQDIMSRPPTFKTDAGQLNNGNTPHLQNVQHQYGMNLQQTKDMFATGWQAGADMALALADDLESVMPAPKDLRRALHHADHGDELDMDKLYSGRFDTMFRTRKRQYLPTQTVITIGTHLCTLWDEPETAMLSGAVGIALARIMERYGYRVELISLLTADAYTERPDTNSLHKFVGMVHVKEAYAPLNAAEIAAVHHPATAQTIVKACMSRGNIYMNNKCECEDFASDFATRFMQHTGRRFDYCFDWIGYPEGAQYELRKAVLALGGRFFDPLDLQELQAQMEDA